MNSSSHSTSVCPKSYTGIIYDLAKNHASTDGCAPLPAICVTDLHKYLITTAMSKSFPRQIVWLDTKREDIAVTWAPGLFSALFHQASRIRHIQHVCTFCVSPSAKVLSDQAHAVSALAVLECILALVSAVSLHHHISSYFTDQHHGMLCLCERTYSLTSTCPVFSLPCTKELYQVADVPNSAPNTSMSLLKAREAREMLPSCLKS